MKRIKKFITNEKTKTVWDVFKIAVMLLLIYVYLMYTDLSTAPEFIYNQF